MSKKTIAIIDYGMGNLHSVASALEHVATGADVIISRDPSEIESASHVIFPRCWSDQGLYGRDTPDEV